MYSTLIPCDMCAGAIVHFGIIKVVYGESGNSPEDDGRELLVRYGVELADLDLEEARRMLRVFIERKPEEWSVDIGRWARREDRTMEIFKESQRKMSAGSETLKLQVIPSASTSATGLAGTQRSAPGTPSAPSIPAGVLQVDANVLVLADTSGSMEGEKIESLRSAVLDFVGRIDDAGEYVGLIDFDDEVAETIPLGPFGTDLNRWSEGVESLDGDGGTAFYDAVSYAISVLENEGVSGRVNIIIALTDGFDEDSQLTANEVISKLQGASVPVLLFALAYGEEYDLPVLEQLAEATGGVAYPATPEDLERLFALLSTLF